MALKLFRVKTEWGYIYQKRKHFYIWIDNSIEERLDPTDELDSLLIEMYLIKYYNKLIKDLAHDAV